MISTLVLVWSASRVSSSMISTSWSTTRGPLHFLHVWEERRSWTVFPGSSWMVRSSEWPQAWHLTLTLDFRREAERRRMSTEPTSRFFLTLSSPYAARPFYLTSSFKNRFMNSFSLITSIPFRASFAASTSSDSPLSLV